MSKNPSKHLIREFLDYSSDIGDDIDEAARLLADYSRQMKPDLDTELATGRARHKVFRETAHKIENSPRISIVARIIVRTRVRYIRWLYYPDFHAVSWPWAYWWCSIAHDAPDWNVGPFEKRVYLDDLFHDGYYGRFWMPEPYLSNLSLSGRVFSELTKEDRESIASTLYYKIDPMLMNEFLEERSDSVDYIQRECDEANLFDRPPYGSKGSRKRLKILPRIGSSSSHFKE